MKLTLDVPAGDTLSAVAMQSEEYYEHDRTPEPSKVPSLEHVLGTFAYHVSCIMGDVPNGNAESVHFGLGLGVHTGPKVHVDVIITPAKGVEDPWGVWAQVSIGGKACGNRCGGREEYAKRCAPVIAWIAANQGK
jgi:hypothetical protein